MSTTHLTVQRSGGVEFNDVKYYGHKGRHTCEGINLPKWLIKLRAAQVGGPGPKNAPAVTDPYRPRIGATPSDDIELVVKGHEELPAEKWVGLRENDPARGPTGRCHWRFG
jgi:hypothetical protein